MFLGVAFNYFTNNISTEPNHIGLKSSARSNAPQMALGAGSSSALQPLMPMDTLFYDELIVDDFAQRLANFHTIALLKVELEIVILGFEDKNDC